jgi:hypothetical protein
MNRKGEAKIKDQVGVQYIEPLPDLLITIFIKTFSLILTPYHLTFLVRYIINAMITNKARLPARSA